MSTFEERVRRLAKAYEEFHDALSPEAQEHFSRLAPEQRDWFTKQMFHDSMVPEVGNKLAYQNYISKPRPGVHVVMDMNDLKALNDTMSYQHGDNALKAMGTAFAAANQHALGSAKEGERRTGPRNIFRVGGDEFRVHFDTPEQAYAFLRHASQGVSNTVPVGGTHKLSFSAGIGESPEQADQALHHAKAAKTAKHGSFRTGSANVGHGQHFVHSLLPQAAGPVPVREESTIPHELRQQRTAPISIPKL